MDSVDQIIENWIGNVTLASGTLTAASRLVDEGWLDSMQIVQLVEFLEQRFSVAIDLDEMIRDNFESIPKVAALVRRSPKAQRL